MEVAVTKKSFLWIVAIFIVCVLIGLRLWHCRQSSGIFESYSSYVLYPLLKIHHAVINPIKSWCINKQNYAELEHTAGQLRQERDDLRAQLIQLHAQMCNYQDIQELVAYTRSQTNVILPAVQIIAKNFSDSQHNFFIDAGSNNGIQRDMVVVYKNILVGKIVEVYPWYSKVLAITDKRCKVSACCLKTNKIGILEGNNNLVDTQLKFISHLDPVVEGDYLISSGQGFVFPRGLGLGQIVSISPHGLYYFIKVKVICDLDKISYCTVISRAAPLEQKQAPVAQEHSALM